MAAFTKNDMNPSLTWYFFSKFSLLAARSDCTVLMSTSLKVVSMAICCLASTNRLAAVLRSIVIGTVSCSRPAASGDLGAEAAAVAGLSDLASTFGFSAGLAAAFFSGAGASGFFFAPVSALAD